MYRRCVVGWGITHLELGLVVLHTLGSQKKLDADWQTRQNDTLFLFGVWPSGFSHRLQLAKMLRAEKHKQQTKMSQKKLSTIIK